MLLRMTKACYSFRPRRFLGPWKLILAFKHPRDSSSLPRGPRVPVPYIKSLWAGGERVV